MSVVSMTGFARGEGQAPGTDWTWEVTSVNGRNLNVRCRLPGGMEALEQPVRAVVSERFKRGHIAVNLQTSPSEGQATVRVNREVLDQVCALARELEDSAGLAPPRPDGLLALRGVIEVVEADETEEARQGREAAMIRSLAEALDELVAMRRQEGERLAEVLSSQLDEIARLAAAGAACAAAQPQTIRARLKEGVAAVLEAAPALSEERLAQEAAILIAKADVREELDRLQAHVAAANQLLQAGGPAGRRLDFLAQEFNREANTLCAKSADVELTHLGLELKAVIDQFREQVQNIE